MLQLQVLAKAWKIDVCSTARRDEWKARKRNGPQAGAGHPARGLLAPCARGVGSLSKPAVPRSMATVYRCKPV